MTTLKAESTAIISDVCVKEGDAVSKGAVLLVTELMKMQHEIRAQISGVVQTVHVAPSDEVESGTPLITLVPGEVAAKTSADPDAGRFDLSAYNARMALLDDSARPDAVAKRRAQGGRTARENIADLFDPDSFQEYGALAIAAQRTERPLEELQSRTQGDGIICGIGTVNGRRVAAMVVDYMVMAGTQGYNHHRKMDRLIEVAGREGLPIVLFAEGGGGRPNDYDVAPLMSAWLNVTSFSNFAAHKGPKIGIAHGFCFAGNAALFGVCDIRIATKQSWVGMGGPAMIEGGGLGKVAPNEIGPSDVQVKTGLLDLLLEDEAAATEATKQILGLPRAQAFADVSKERDESLRHIVPSDRKKAYDMRDAVLAVADPGSFLEVGQGFGIGAICGFARVKGRGVGVFANNPLHLGGAIDVDAATKGARFLELCDAWNMPLLTLCDTPGFMVGPDIEEAGQVAQVSRLFVAGARFSQPLVTIILRKGYGLGAMAMAGGGFSRPVYCCAWPTGEVGAMGLEGAVQLGYRDHLTAIEDPKVREAEYTRLVDELYERGSALNAASLLEFDAVIDPKMTRDVIDRALSPDRAIS
ncbi:carboxyl transferase domain-containing protein [Planktotalea sp.]|uniref:carboxyl transferase domain-containing protein n=1 Tax=Planktotalea sp. TaxID=2029877 RepID=UPI003296D975